MARQINLKNVKKLIAIRHQLLCYRNVDAVYEADYGDDDNHDTSL